jgi:hypothetical protein
MLFTYNYTLKTEFPLTVTNFAFKKVKNYAHFIHKFKYYNLKKK